MDQDPNVGEGRDPDEGVFPPPLPPLARFPPPPVTPPPLPQRRAVDAVSPDAGAQHGPAEASGGQAHSQHGPESAGDVAQHRPDAQQPGAHSGLAARHDSGSTEQRLSETNQHQQAAPESGGGQPDAIDRAGEGGRHSGQTGQQSGAAAQHTPKVSEHGGSSDRQWRQARLRVAFAVVGAAAVVATIAVLIFANRNEGSSAQRPPTQQSSAAPAVIVPAIVEPGPTTIPAEVTVATEEAASPTAPAVTDAPVTTARVAEVASEPWSFAFFQGDAIVPSLAGYACGGLASTWTVIFGPGSPLLERTFELPFAPDVTSVHYDLVFDFPPDGTSPAVHIEWRWDYLLDTASNPPFLRITGMQHETPEGGTESVFDDNFGTGDGIQLEPRSLPDLLATRNLSYPFLDRAALACG